MRYVWLLAILTILLPASTLSAAKEYTYIDLVNKLVDLKGLAVLPEPGEKCAQWSSYDRSSVYDTATGKYLNWDANGDNGGHIRKEGDKRVLAEMKGPGCIWRIWSAAPGNGHVRVYLDGATEPAVDLPFIGYFDGTNPPFNYPSLVHTVAQGWNCYIPIPYQKSCRIVADKDWGNYYHFTYTTFSESTIVPTFNRNLNDEEKAALKAVDQFLSDKLGTNPASIEVKESVITRNIKIQPGDTVQFFKTKGVEGAVTSIKIKLNPKSIKDPAKTLREVVFQVYYGNEKDPGVWVPVGDFFGAPAGIHEHISLPVGITKSGECYSYWYMPFDEEGAVFELVNESKEPFSVEIKLTATTDIPPIEQLGRFHAKWHLDAFPPAEPERAAIDWTMLKTTGRGRFCGVMLHVWNPRGGWWGEGDEKFHIDGEKHPSTFGTGSEDYFGYAWCDPTVFQHAFHNQPISEGNAGNICVSRWHIADNIPFQTSFDGFIEKYFPNDRPTQYACTVYWYLAPGGTDPYKPVSVEERIDYRQEPKVYTEPDALEGEKLDVIEVTSGTVKEQRIYEGWGDYWSRGKQLWWIGARPGAKLTLAVPVEKSGSYEISANFTRAIDYGIVQLYLNGKKIGRPVDLYNDGVVPSGEVQFGNHELSAGENKITVEIIGANEKAQKSYMVGIDYIKLKPTQ